MNDVFTDEQLNVGKVLVLACGHKLKLEEIKRMTKATKVRKLKWTVEEDDIDTFVLATMYKTISALGRQNLIGSDVYRVSGDDAVTTMMTFKLGESCKSVNLDAMNIKKLHNACLTKQSIDRAKVHMANAIDSHNDLSVMLTKRKIKNSVTKKTNALDKLIQGYADKELNVTMGEIKEVMGRIW